MARAPAGALALAALPAELARRGYDRAELCHFHLASRQPAYLRDIRAAFAAAGVSIQTLLIDDGDITGSQRERDLNWISGWVESAAALGADCARVIAGKAKPSDEALAQSIAGLRRIGAEGKVLGVRIVTENWFDLLAGPREVHQVLDALDGGVGFLADTGNWKGRAKYADLASVFGRAERCHAKAEFGPGLVIDGEDFAQCIRAAAEAGYAGPYTLVFESEGEPWAGVAAENAFITAALVGGPAQL